MDRSLADESISSNSSLGLIDSKTLKGASLSFLNSVDVSSRDGRRSRDSKGQVTREEAREEEDAGAPEEDEVTQDHVEVDPDDLAQLDAEFSDFDSSRLDEELERSPPLTDDQDKSSVYHSGEPSPVDNVNANRYNASSRGSTGQSYRTAESAAYSSKHNSNSDLRKGSQTPTESSQGFSEVKETSWDPFTKPVAGSRDGIAEGSVSGLVENEASLFAPPITSSFLSSSQKDGSGDWAATSQQFNPFDGNWQEQNEAEPEQFLERSASEQLKFLEEEEAVNRSQHKFLQEEAMAAGGGSAGADCSWFNKTNESTPSAFFQAKSAALGASLSDEAPGAQRPNWGTNVKSPPTRRCMSETSVVSSKAAVEESGAGSILDEIESSDEEDDGEKPPESKNQSSVGLSLHTVSLDAPETVPSSRDLGPSQKTYPSNKEPVTDLERTLRNFGPTSSTPLSAKTQLDGAEMLGFSALSSVAPNRRHDDTLMFSDTVKKAPRAFRDNGRHREETEVKSLCWDRSELFGQGVGTYHQAAAQEVTLGAGLGPLPLYPADLETPAGVGRSNACETRDFQSDSLQTSALSLSAIERCIQNASVGANASALAEAILKSRRVVAKQHATAVTAKKSCIKKSHLAKSESGLRTDAAGGNQTGVQNEISRFMQKKTLVSSTAACASFVDTPIPSASSSKHPLVERQQFHLAHSKSGPGDSKPENYEMSALSKTGAPKVTTGKLEASKMRLVFGCVGLGRRAVQTTMVRNSSSEIMRLGVWLRHQQPSFELVELNDAAENCVLLSPGETSAIKVAFTPSKVQMYQNKIVLDVYSSPHHFGIPLVGWGGQAEVAVDGHDSSRAGVMELWFSSLAQLRRSYRLKNSGTRAAFVKQVVYEDGTCCVEASLDSVIINQPNLVLKPGDSKLCFVTISKEWFQNRLRSAGAVRGNMGCLTIYWGEESQRQRIKQWEVQRGKPLMAGGISLTDGVATPPSLPSESDDGSVAVCSSDARLFVGSLRRTFVKLVCLPGDLEATSAFAQGTSFAALSPDETAPGAHFRANTRLH